eukprot:491976-Hanusia_phi.AAC.1
MATGTCESSSINVNLPRPESQCSMTAALPGFRPAPPGGAEPGPLHDSTSRSKLGRHSELN